MFCAACDNSALSGSPRPSHPQPSAQNASVLTLSELPEPPIPVSEIGPIPPPPMFSSPSPTVRRFNQSGHHATPMDTSSSTSYDGKKIRLRVLCFLFYLHYLFIETHFLRFYGIFPCLWPPPPSPWLLFLRGAQT